MCWKYLVKRRATVGSMEIRRSNNNGEHSLIFVKEHYNCLITNEICSLAGLEELS